MSCTNCTCTCSCSCNECSSEPIQFYIGDGGDHTPMDGSTIYNNNCLKYTKYLVSKNGFGFFIEDRDYERLSAGGFKLLNSAAFDTGETFTIIIYK